MAQQQFSGRGGAGNYHTKPSQADPSSAVSADATNPKSFFSKPALGNFSGRGGAGNHRSKDKRDSMPDAPAAPTPPGLGARTASSSSASPIVYKGGRGGAGNIEAVQFNERNKEDLEIQELIRVHSELQETGALPTPPTERPILRID